MGVNNEFVMQLQLWYVEEVMIGSTLGATVPVTDVHSKCNALVDTGGTRSCINKAYCQPLMIPQLHKLFCIAIRSASGSNLQPLGLATCNSKFLFYEFILCKYLKRPFILDL